jgi:uncharacterized protein with LGFP repeats
MTDSPPDDARLRATEAQMRRALGLQGEASPRSEDEHLPNPTLGAHRLPRRFVRDGDVPVTVVRRDHHADGDASTNQLDAARQAVRAEAAARQHAERLLSEAQTTIRDLQTKLAHERLAKDEVVQALRRAESDREAAVQALRAVEVEPAATQVPAPLPRAKQQPSSLSARRKAKRHESGPDPEPGGPAATVVQAARKSRRKVPADDQEPVKWWVKGWQKNWR